MKVHLRSGIARPAFLVVLASAAAAGLLLLRGPRADRFYLRFDAESFATQSLGTRVGGEFDRLELCSFSDTLSLAENVPTVAPISVATFVVGFTGEPITVSSSLSRPMTINGVTRTLTQEMTIDTGIDTDYITIHDGRTVSFEVAGPGWTGVLDVTPLGRRMTGSWTVATDTRPLEASFLLHDVRR